MWCEGKGGGEIGSQGRIVSSLDMISSFEIVCPELAAVRICWERDRREDSWSIGEGNTVGSADGVAIISNYGYKLNQR